MMCTMANRLLTLVVGTLLVSGCASPTPAPSDTTADETALKEITQTWLKSYNAADAETMAALYAEDAVLTPPHAPIARGRAAIREFLAKDSAGGEARARTGDGGCKRRLGMELGLVHGAGWIGEDRR